MAGVAFAIPLFCAYAMPYCILKGTYNIIITTIDNDCNIEIDAVNSSCLSTTTAH